MRHCLACRNKLAGPPIFHLENAPASAQNIPDAKEVKEDRGIALDLFRCDGCGLVQFDCEPVSYYRDVIRAGGFSTTMKELRRSQYQHLIDTWHLEGKRFLEVGCGRGEFIQVLTEFPVEVYGMEHKPELVELAREAGLQVWQEFPETADQKFAGGKLGLFDVFLSFNFLEHQPRPDVMLRAIYGNLSEDGMGLVTVPALEYIWEQGSYYELIRDHIAYYSFETLGRLLEENGFAVLEEEIINRDTIAAVVKKVPLGMKAGEDQDSQRSSEAQGSLPLTGAQDLQSPAIVQELRPHAPEQDPLAAGYEATAREMEELAERLAAEKRTLAIWGASHQGFTLAATSCLGQAASYIIDSAPFKQGRFAPASHLPIVSPDYALEHPVDEILIVAPGYTEEIAGIIRERFGENVTVWTIRTSRLERL